MNKVFRSIPTSEVKADRNRKNINNNHIFEILKEYHEEHGSIKHGQ